MTALRSALGALAFSTCLASFPALAQEPAAVGERLKAMFKVQGVDLAYAGISGDADEMIIEGVTVKPTAETTALPIGRFTLTDVSEEGGVYFVGSMAMDRYLLQHDGFDVIVAGVEITGLELPAEQDGVVTYETADLEEFSVTKAGKPIFALNGFSVEVTPSADGTPLSFTGGAESFSADLTQVEEAEARKVIEELGYTTLAGSIAMAGSWNPSDGRTVLSQYDMTIEDAGKLGISMDLSGYTAAFQKAAREVQAKLAATPEGGDNSAAGIEMLGLMQQLTFHGATIRFDDDSITSKVIAYVAKQQGAQPADIANQAKALLPFMLAQLNSPEFAAQVTAAANAFIDAPKNLTITAKPAAPIPFALVAAGAMTAPQSLPQQLGVSVTANQ